MKLVTHTARRILRRCANLNLWSNADRFKYVRASIRRFPPEFQPGLASEIATLLRQRRNQGKTLFPR